MKIISAVSSHFEQVETRMIWLPRDIEYEELELSLCGELSLHHK
jgi:hypothetical protein